MRMQPVLVLLTAAVCTTCGGSPASPSSASPSGSVATGSFDGLWTATYTTTYCDGESARAELWQAVKVP